MTNIIDGRTITCILAKGRAHELVSLLKEDKGISTAHMSSARGSGTTTSAAGSKGIGQIIEKDIFTVVVSETRADEIFEFIYREGGVDHAHGGFMYMSKPMKFADYVLPDLPQEEA